MNRATREVEKKQAYRPPFGTIWFRQAEIFRLRAQRLRCSAPRLAGVATTIFRHNSANRCSNWLGFADQWPTFALRQVTCLAMRSSTTTTEFPTSQCASYRNCLKTRLIQRENGRRCASNKHRAASLENGAHDIQPR